MLKIERFVNELMTSNCYVVYDEDTKRCLVIDPGSEKSQREIDFIERNDLCLEYVIITHEHADHNWGVNALREEYENSQLICSEICDKNVKMTNRVYFLFYYDDPEYRYEIARADIVIKENDVCMLWNRHQIKFLLTPGHSRGSMCVLVEKMLFSGDTIMAFKPYFNGRGSNEDDWLHSISTIKRTVSADTLIYPGHGENFLLHDYTYYNNE